MKQINSGIIISHAERRSKTGTRRGELGLQTRSNSEIGQWLAEQDPADMNKAALSRASSHGAELMVRYEGRYPTGPNGEHLTGYSIAVGCEMDGSQESAEMAWADLINFMIPAPNRNIEEWIARLSVITAKRKDDQFSEELRIMEYTDRLSRYPADVVRAVLLENTYKFFPTWDELHRKCEELTSPRRQMISALDRGPAPQQASKRPATAEEKARIQKLVDDMFPAKSAEMRKAAVEEALKGNCMKDDGA